MDNISTLAQVHEALQLLGYVSAVSPDSVVVKVGGLKKPFRAVITHNAMTQQFQITCMIAKLGDIPEEKVAPFSLAALDANVRIAPYAYALLTSQEGDEKQWPIVLIETIPIGDLCSDELSAAMEGLVAALVDCRGVLDAFNVQL